MIWSQVPTGSSLLRINQGSAPTLRGRALCHILAMIWVTVEFRRFSCWTKVMMLGGVLLPPSIPVSSLSRISEKRGVAHVARWLLVLISRIPGEVRDEAEFKNPIN
jgi:hypothetical protein